MAKKQAAAPSKPRIEARVQGADDSFFDQPDDPMPTEAEVKEGLEAASKLHQDEGADGLEYIDDPKEPTAEEKASADLEAKAAADAAAALPAGAGAAAGAQAPAGEDAAQAAWEARLAEAQQAQHIAEMRAADLETQAGKTQAQLAAERETAEQKVREDRLTQVEQGIIDAIANQDSVLERRLSFERERLAREISKADQARTIAELRQAQAPAKVAQREAAAGMTEAQIRQSATERFFALNGVDGDGQKKWHESVQMMLAENPGRVAAMPMWQAMHEALRRSRSKTNGKGAVPAAASAEGAGGRAVASTGGAPRLPANVSEKDFARAARLYGSTPAEYRKIYDKYTSGGQ